MLTGKGRYGLVKKAVLPRTGEVFAVKIISTVLSIGTVPVLLTRKGCVSIAKERWAWHCGGSYTIASAPRKRALLCDALTSAVHTGCFGSGLPHKV